MVSRLKQVHHDGAGALHTVQKPIARGLAEYTQHGGTKEEVRDAIYGEIRMFCREV